MTTHCIVDHLYRRNLGHFHMSIQICSACNTQVRETQFSSPKSNCPINRTSALRACLRCAAGGHFVSAGGSLRSPGVTLVNYKGDNISKYVCSTVLIDITRKITKFVNFKIFDA